VQAVGCGLSGLAAQFSDESALEVCIHVMRYTSRRLYFLLFTLFRGQNPQSAAMPPTAKLLSPLFHFHIKSSVQFDSRQCSTGRIVAEHVSGARCFAALP